MIRKKFDRDLLGKTLLRDKASLVGDYNKLTREVIINFICNCGKSYSKDFKGVIERSGLFCKECSVKNKKEKYKQTNLKLYGVEHPSKKEEIRIKAKETLMKNYGVEYPMQSKEIKDNTKEVYLKKYGTLHSSQNGEVKNKVNSELVSKLSNFKDGRSKLKSGQNDSFSQEKSSGNFSAFRQALSNGLL